MSAEAQTQFDELLTSGASIKAIALVRDHLGEPRPHLHDCMDLLVVRADDLGHHPADRHGEA
ncbi:hypothetical protein [Nocardia sp. NPDC004123]